MDTYMKGNHCKKAWRKILCKRKSTKSKMALGKQCKQGAEALPNHTPWLPGHAKGKGSANRPISEHELQLAEHQIPVLASGVPVFHDLLSGQIEHPAQGIVISKAGFVFGGLPELAVKALNDVRRVYDFPNLRRVFIKGAQNLPIFLPTLHAGGVLATPFFSKLEKRILRLIQGDSGVYFFQVSRHLFDILPTDVSGGRADLMDDAALETAVGIHGLDGLHHAA